MLKAKPDCKDLVLRVVMLTEDLILVVVIVLQTVNYGVHAVEVFTDTDKVQIKVGKVGFYAVGISRIVKSKDTN